jgi:hypothetical protein
LEFTFACSSCLKPNFYYSFQFNSLIGFAAALISDFHQFENRATSLAISLYILTQNAPTLKIVTARD